MLWAVESGMGGMCLFLSSRAGGTHDQVCLVTLHPLCKVTCTNRDCPTSKPLLTSSPDLLRSCLSVKGYGPCLSGTVPVDAYRPSTTLFTRPSLSLVEFSQSGQQMVIK